MNKNQSLSVQLADITSRLFANCQEKEARHCSKFGVSIVEFRCLKILHEHEQLTVNQLAHEMSLTSSRITRIIDGLVSKQLVQRVGGVSDRRIYNLFLTPKGKKLTAELIQNYLKIHKEILDSIPATSQQQMVETLLKLNDALEQWLKSE